MVYILSRWLRHTLVLHATHLHHAYATISVEYEARIKNSAKFYLPLFKLPSASRDSELAPRVTRD